MNFSFPDFFSSLLFSSLFFFFGLVANFWGRSSRLQLAWQGGDSQRIPCQCIWTVVLCSTIVAMDD